MKDKAFTDKKSIFIFLLSALVVAVYFSMPFATLTINKRRFTLSPWQLLTANLRLPDQILALPAITRLASALLLGCLLVSVLCSLYKKSGVFALSLLLGGLLSICLYESTVVVCASVGRAGMVLLTMLCLIGSLAGFAIRNAERLASVIFLLLSLTALLSLAAIVGFLAAMGIPAIAKIGIGNFLIHTKWSPTANPPSFGIGAMILATLFATVGASVLAAPIGVLTAVFLAELSPRALANTVRPAIDLLAGIPSVIFGFFGMMVVVPFVRDVFHAPVGDGLLSVILILTMMILPTVISLSETSLRAVPRAYEEASLGLGATKMQTIFKVLLPAARSGISAGLILGIGRALGETMAVMMVAGNVVNLPGLFKTVRPMTAGIVLEMAYAEGLHRGALFGIGLVLLVFILFVNVLFHLFLRKAEKRYEA